MPFGDTLCCPTRTGIAIRLSEWNPLKQAIEKLHRDNMAVANYTPCYLQHDHQNQSGMVNGVECNPFDRFMVQYAPAVNDVAQSTVDSRANDVDKDDED